MEQHVEQGSVTVTRAASAWVSTDAASFVCFRGELASSAASASKNEVGEALVRATRAFSMETGVRIWADVLVSVGSEVRFRVREGGTSTQRRAWLRSVADQLSASRWTGQIDRPRRLHPPDRLLQAGQGVPWPTIWFRFDEPTSGRPQGGETAQVELADIERLLSLFPFDGKVVYVGSNMDNFPQPADASLPVLVRDLAAESAFNLHAGESPLDVLRVNLAASAATVTRISNAPWTERVAEGRRALKTLADRLILGYIRISPPGTYAGQASPPPEYPAGDRGAYYFHTPRLWGEYVIDAHGVQLITDKALARARDLSEWRVTAAAPGRYLLEANDLTGWYSDLLPDPDVLSRARQDFGDMIVPTQLLEQAARERVGMQRG